MTVEKSFGLFSSTRSEGFDETPTRRRVAKPTFDF